MKKEILAQVSLVLGIISISFSAIECFLPLVILGIILGISAIVLGIIAVKEFGKKAVSGIILGITGVIASSIWLYFALIIK